MAAIELLLEAERRGILPPNKQALLDEARRRGLVPPKETETPEEETGATGQFAKTVGLGVAPTAAAMAGFGAGAANPLAIAADPYTLGGASLVSGLIGAGIAAYGAGKLQEKAIEAAPETAKALGITPEQMARGAAAHPTATKLGELATTLGSFELGPERALLSRLAAKETRAEAAKELAKQTATNVGIMSAQDVATQAMSDRPFDVGELGEAALTGAVLGKPRSWAQGAERLGRAATMRTAEALRSRPIESLEGSTYDTGTEGRGIAGGPSGRVRVGEEAAAPGAGGSAELSVPLTETGERGAARVEGEGLGAPAGPAVQPAGREEKVEPALTPTHTFTTSRGSTYTQYEDGSTVRNRSGKDHVDTTTGVQPKSGKTIYLDESDVGKVGGLIQNPDIPTRLVPELGNDNKPTGRVQVELTEDYGPKKSGTVLTSVPYSTEPAVGKSPVEIWRSESPVGDAGSGIHFGTKITEVAPVKPAEAPPVAPAPAAQEAPKSMFELRRAAASLSEKPSSVKTELPKMGGTSWYEKAVTNVQDQSRKVTKLQEDLKATGELETVGENRTDIANAASTAANKTGHIINTEVKPVQDRLEGAVEAYARANKLDYKDAQADLDGMVIALHEEDRRGTKFLRDVPLKPEAAAEREQLEQQRHLADTPEKQAAIYNRLVELAANHADPYGFSPTGAKTVDKADRRYNVLPDEYTQDILNAERARYQNLAPEQKALVENYRSALNESSKLAVELDRRANYWTDKVDNVVGTYNWGDRYVTIKGMPGADITFEPNNKRLSGDLTEIAAGFEGKGEEFNSPTMQSIANMYAAANRAGRADVTKTIKNLVNRGIITTKTAPEKIEFEDRQKRDFDETKYKGRDKIIHHNPDGSVEVYSLANEDLLEAIKQPYREMGTLTRVGNKITGIVGQGFTRLSPAFAPKNFIRDTITNAFQIFAKENPILAAEYVGTVMSHVLNGGLLKAARFSKLRNKGDKATLERLANSGDKVYQDMLEMDRYGGRSVHRMIYNVNKQSEALVKSAGPDRVIKNRNGLLSWVDGWNDAFEISARTGAYSARKAHNIAEARKRGLNVKNKEVMEDIKKEAAAFSLGLMDFSKVGKYGREISAMYMFMRPSLTGAVNAIDALRPAFQFSTKKAFSRLEPELQARYETHSLAEEVKKLEQSATPDREKINALKDEIAARQKKFDEFETRHRTKQMTALGAASVAVAAGAALYHMAVAAGGEDAQGRNRVKKDDMSRWVRDLRLPVLGEHEFLNVPWGFGVSGLMSLGAQFAAMQSVGMPMKKFLGNITQIATDSYLPIPASKIDPTENFGLFALDSVMPSVARPVTEFITNMNGYGSPIYNARAGKYLDAYSGSTRSTDTHRAISEFFLDNFGIDMSPDTVAFLLNSYAAGPAMVFENGINVSQVIKGAKDFDPRTDALVLRGFIGTEANYDAEKYAAAQKKIQDLSRTAESMKKFGTAEKIRDFYQKNPRAEALIAMYNQGANGTLKKLQEARNRVLRDRTMQPKQRKQALDDIDLSMNYVKKGLVDRFEALGLK